MQRRRQARNGIASLLGMIEALESSPRYRALLELRLIRVLAIRNCVHEIDALCLDLDRLFRDERFDLLLEVVTSFRLSLFLALHGESALRRGERDSARRWFEAAQIAAGDHLYAVGRSVLARLPADG